jgi:hypothetical protein
MPKPDANAERAQRLVQALRQQRDQGGDAYPLTVSRLASLADPDASPQEIDKALTKKPFANEVVRANKKDVNSPVALAEDAGRLAGSPLLLEYALGRLCQAEEPLQPLPKVLNVIDKPLRPAFEAAVRGQLDAGALPDLAGSRKVKNKLFLYLKRLPPPPEPPAPAAVLAEKLVQVLREQRSRGDGSYPMSLKELLDRADPQAKTSLLRQALTHEPFQSQALVSLPGKLDALVALAEDRAALAANPRVLESVLKLTTSKKEPLATLHQLQEPLSEALRRPFTDAVRRQVEKLLHTLHELQRQGESYPTTLDRLLERADSSASADVVKKALSNRNLKPNLVLALPKNPQSPVALASDAERLAASPLLLETALTAVRAPDNEAVAVKDLAKQVAKPLQPAFLDTMNTGLENGTLPAQVGCLIIKKQPMLFLLKDVSGRKSAPPQIVPERRTRRAPVETALAEAPTVDFAQQFEGAFERLNRETGAHNLVSLVGLRQAIPADRVVFDEGLQQLRRSGRFSLVAAEGRHGISEAEQEAGIDEEGTLLLYVSRRAT